MPRWLWLLTQLTRKLWLRATLIGMLGVVAAVLSAVVERYIPWEIPGSIGADAIDSLLNVIATSMLAVTTFSLSVTTSAFASATSNVTPRATRLLMEDRTTQNVLSSFIGSFLFSIVGIVVLKTGAYGDRGRLILFGMTVAVIVLIVVTLLRWIDHLTRLGRVGETTERVERATREAIEIRCETPFLGGRPLANAGDLPAGGLQVSAGRVGYIRNVDMTALSACADELDRDIVLAVVPGAFVYPDSPLARIPIMPSAKKMQEATERVRAAFSIGSERSFDQDPRFGLVVMSEIAMRALSPAVNDPGTAIDVIGRNTRLLSLWAEAGRRAADDVPKHPRIHVPPLSTADLFEDSFMLIARDGAGHIEVQLRMRKALQALSRMGNDDFRAAAVKQAELALERARTALVTEHDFVRLADVRL
nr:DUF2254 domain-containing protein [Methyloversatilis thermotolerans]